MSLDEEGGDLDRLPPTKLPSAYAELGRFLDEHKVSDENLQSLRTYKSKTDSLKGAYFLNELMMYNASTGTIKARVVDYNQRGILPKEVAEKYLGETSGLEENIDFWEADLENPTTETELWLVSLSDDIAELGQKHLEAKKKHASKARDICENVPQNEAVLILARDLLDRYGIPKEMHHELLQAIKENTLFRD